MNMRERFKELLPVIQAYADGREVEYRPNGRNEWVTVTGNLSFVEPPGCYRIKPEPKFRPFNSGHEARDKIIASPWARPIKDNGSAFIITEVNHVGVFFGNAASVTTWSELFETFVTINGDRFGVQLETETQS